jgi:hypothetical protein
MCGSGPPSIYIGFAFYYYYYYFFYSPAAFAIRFDGCGGAIVFCAVLYCLFFTCFYVLALIIAIKFIIVKEPLTGFTVAGGRDKRGGPIMLVPSDSKFEDMSEADLSTCLSYLAQLPRSDNSFFS